MKKIVQIIMVSAIAFFSYLSANVMSNEVYYQSLGTYKDPVLTKDEATALLCFEGEASAAGLDGEEISSHCLELKPGVAYQNIDVLIQGELWYWEDINFELHDEQTYVLQYQIDEDAITAHAEQTKVMTSNNFTKKVLQTILVTMLSLLTLVYSIKPLLKEKESVVSNEISFSSSEGVAVAFYPLLALVPTILLTAFVNVGLDFIFTFISSDVVIILYLLFTACMYIFIVTRISKGIGTTIIFSNELMIWKVDGNIHLSVPTQDIIFLTVIKNKGRKNFIVKTTEMERYLDIRGLPNKTINKLITFCIENNFYHSETTN